jgi:hypothetical protein
MFSRSWRTNLRVVILLVASLLAGSVTADFFDRWAFASRDQAGSSDAEEVANRSRKYESAEQPQLVDKAER